MRVTAFAVKGRGLASRYRSGELQEIAKRHGVNLVPGSLNLIGKSPVWLRSDAAFFVNGIHHFWRARLFDYPVILNRWAVHCPVHVYEIFAEEHLRSKFSLSDGDPVTLDIDDSSIDERVHAIFWKQALWYGVWRGRESLAYHDGLYRRLVYNRRLYWMMRHMFHEPAIRRDQNGGYIR